MDLAGGLSGLLGYQLRLAQLRAFNCFASAMEGEPVTPLVAGLLLLIEREGGINQGELAGALGADRSTMVRLLDQLERGGYVKRVALPSDRRHTVPTLTPAGHALLTRIRPKIVASEEAMAEPLSATERDRLLAILRKFNRR